jgi:hypothetical protein
MLRSLQHPALAARLLVLTALGGSLALLPGCDSPACVFGPGGCNGAGAGNGGGPGAAGSAPAVELETGMWLDADGPSTFAMIPGPGETLHPSSVLAVEFDVSMAADSLSGAFRLVDTIFGTVVPVVEPPPLVANGRVALLVPSQPLAPGSIYQLSWEENAQPSDVVGRVGAFSGVVGSFDVQLTQTPRVLGTFPLDGEEAAGDLTEVFVLFDQPMDAGSVTLASLKVEVGPGVPPQAEPAQPVVLAGAVPVPVLQAWTWSLRDADGEPISLGAGTDMRVTCTADLRSQGGGGAGGGQPLEETVITFQTGTLRAPVNVEKPFLPFDAIGLADLASAAPLVEVELPDPAPVGGAAQSLGVAITGASRANQSPIGLVRTIAVPEGDQLVPAGVEALGFVDSLGSPYLADGEVTLVAWSSRAGRLSQARRFRAVGASLELPIEIDTIPPLVTELGPNGGTTEVFTSDQRDLVLVGRATEQVAFVRVRALDPATGDPVTNAFDPDGAGSLPEQDPAPVVMSGPAGLFIAQPAPIGVVDPLDPWTFEYEVFDRALNGSEPQLAVPFVQRGVLGAGAPAAGAATLFVGVFDAVTLAPLEGAQVYLHDGSTLPAAPPLVGAPGTTDALGQVELPLGGAAPVVTAVAAGYDLLTVLGSDSQSLQLLLQPQGSPTANASGEVRVAATSGLDIASPLVRTLAADGRGVASTVPTNPATLDSEAGDIVRTFGPYPMAAGQLGAQSALVTVPDAPFATFVGATFLLGFGSRAPAPPLPAGNTPSPIQIRMPGPLLAQPTQEQSLDSGLSPIPLQLAAGDWQDLIGAPTVLVEARSPGLPRPWIVGAGKSEQLAPAVWPFKAAWPGAFDVVDDDGPGPADQLGSAVLTGQVEPDLWVRVAYQDLEGSRGSSRWSVAGADPVGLTALSPPRITGVNGLPPGVGDPPVLPVFPIEVALPDPGALDLALGVRLEAANGRSWDLLQLAPGAGSAALWALDVGLDEASFPLAAGLQVQATARALPAVELGDLTFGDLERRVLKDSSGPERAAFNQ